MPLNSRVKICALIPLSILTVWAGKAQTMYVLTESWKAFVIDIPSLQVVDSFEIVQEPPPLLEERGQMDFAEFVPEKNVLFVSNTTGGSRAGPPGLKAMKVDLSTKISTVFFRDQYLTTGPVLGSLMPSAGDYYYDIEDKFLYAHYYSTVFVLDDNGNIVNTFNNVPWLALDPSYPRFGKKVYRSGAESLAEFDLTTCKERKVLTNLPWVGGDPYAGGTEKFLSQTSTTADILIADRKTYRLSVDKSDDAPWTIREQEQWFYMVEGQQLGDVAGYKRFDGQLLTVTPGQGDLKFWVFNPTQGPNMPLVYLVNLLPPHIMWHGVPDPPREMYNPVAQLVPGTNKVVASYTGDTFDRFRLVVLDATTGEQLKVFDMYGGLAALLFK